MKYKIGYIDEQQQQIQRYERKLRPYFDVIDFDITKGLTLEKLLQRIYESEINLLLVDYLLVEKGVLTYNGDEVVREFEKIRPRFPMLIFTNLESQAFPQVDNPNIIIDKELLNNNLKKFVEIVKKNIKLYNNFIFERKEKITTLLEKGKKKSLTSKDKNDLLEAQLELKNLDKAANEVPYQLLTEEKLESISQTRKEAEIFLKSLIKKNKK